MRKDNVEIADLAVKIQQMDPHNLLMVVTPVVLYFASKATLKYVKNNYNLHRDFKPTNILTLDLPDDVIRKTSDIDEERLLSIQFGKNILNLAKRMIEAIPRENLNLFYNNLESLKIETKNFELINFLLQKRTSGLYHSIKNTMRLEPETYQITMPHELIHTASTYYRKSDKTIFCGFAQGKPHRRPFGIGLTEGYTQLLTERYFKNTHTLMVAYVYQKRAAENLELILGPDKMQNLYFNANLYGLVQELKKYENVDDIIKFIFNLDYLTMHFDNKNQPSNAKSKIITSISEVNNFLLSCYLKKVLMEHENKDVEYDEIINTLADFMIRLPDIVNTENTKYVIEDDDYLSKTIEKVMGIFFENDEQKAL